MENLVKLFAEDTYLAEGAKRPTHAEIEYLTEAILWRSHFGPRRSPKGDPDPVGSVIMERDGSAADAAVAELMADTDNPQVVEAQLLATLLAPLLRPSEGGRRGLALRTK